MIILEYYQHPLNRMAHAVSRSDFIPTHTAESQTAWVDTHPTASGILVGFSPPYETHKKTPDIRRFL